MAPLDHPDLDRQKLFSDMVTRVAIVLVTLTIVSTLTLLAFLVYQARDQTVANGTLTKEVLATQHLLADCTTPGGECFREGQDRTAKAVQGINKGNLIAVAAVLDCRGKGHETAQEILACAERLVDALMSDAP